LTGAIHIDGFLDTADAALASVPLERRREILKDPHHGTFAVASFAVAAVLWFAAIQALPSDALAGDLAVAGFAARSAALLAPQVRELKPSASSLVLGIPGALIWIWLVVASHAWAVLLVFPLAMMIARVLFRRFGRMSGDLYGFIIVCCEVCALIVLAVIEHG
jgi:adenosylcobinamide-GDP ribazoletransferase